MSKLIKFITLEDTKKLIDAEKDKHYKLAYMLGFGSGLRISEVIGDAKYPPLNKDMVDLKTHQIRLKGKGKGEGKERITTTSPWLTEAAITMLPLKMPRRTLQNRIECSSLRVLGHKVSFHTLRHGFGNYMVNVKNVPLPMVQQMMGHSRIDTTGIYTKANPVETINQAWNAWGDK